MAWITPKTDWAETDFCTYSDMNRIAGNLNYLLDASTLKDDYTQNDVVTLTEWEAIIDAIETLSALYGYDYNDILNNSATAQNFANVETLTLELRNWIDLLVAQKAARAYLGDPIYLGDGQYLR